MNQKNFIGAVCLGLISYMGFCGAAQAQVYSQNIVGYYFLNLQPGNNLIANQLGRGDDTLENLFTNNFSDIPEGTTFTKWDAASVQYLPTSTYDTSSGWSINYGLTYGEGGLLNAPYSFTNILFGTI